MGKHNGKSRNKGLQVGGALLRRKHVQDGRHKTNQGDAASRHTTEVGADGGNMQSIVEMNDLDELMNMVSVRRGEGTTRCRVGAELTTFLRTFAPADAGRAVAEGLHSGALRARRHPNGRGPERRHPDGGGEESARGGAQAPPHGP